VVVDVAAAVVPALLPAVVVLVQGAAAQYLR